MRKVLPLIAAIVLLGAAAPAASAAGGLPPVHVSYDGSYTFKQTSSPKTYEETGSWSAEGVSGGRDGALSLEFTKLSGGLTNLGNFLCEGERETTEWSLNGEEDPAPGDWSIQESSGYPGKGWKYILTGSPGFLPATVKRTCLPVLDGARETQQLQLNEIISPLGLPPSAAAEKEALFATLEVLPGHTASRTRTLSYSGPIPGCQPGAACTTISESASFSVTVSSPASSTEESPTAKHGKGKGHSGPAKQRKASEARRRQLKDQAKADLKPALEGAWEAHGLAGAIGLGTGVGISEVAADLSAGAVSLDGNDALARAVNDYRIVKDPPANGYGQLAEPKQAAPPALPACARFSGPAGSYCEQLRAAETSLLRQGGQAVALDEALYTTIARDSAAIKARDYKAAAAQAKHFEALHQRFEAALAAQGREGASVVSLLRRAGVRANLSRAKSAAAVAWLEKRLRGHGITASSLKGLGVGSALKPRALEALSVLAHPAG